MRRPPPNPNYNREPELSDLVAYAICRNLYGHMVTGEGAHLCVCEQQGRGQSCDQMNRAALDVVQTIVKYVGKDK